MDINKKAASSLMPKAAVFNHYKISTSAGGISSFTIYQIDDLLSPVWINLVFFAGKP
jgi:hypothetical protein